MNSRCTICSSNDTQVLLTTQDYFLTNESFKIIQCNNCKINFTDPVPPSLDQYYKSDKYYSHNKDSKGFTSTIYLTIKNLAIKWKLGLIKRNAPNATTILDVGSGAGDFIKLCSTTGFQTAAMEPSLATQKYYHNTNISLYQSLHEPTNTFDVITLWHVLEHIPDPIHDLKKLATLLNPNGTLLIAVPNIQSWDSKHYKNFWAGLDVPRHLWHFTKENIEPIFSKNGFKLVKVIGMPQDSFYVSLLSEQYKKSGTVFSWLKAVTFGLYSNLNALFTGEYSSQIYILKKTSDSDNHSGRSSASSL